MYVCIQDCALCVHECIDTVCVYVQCETVLFVCQCTSNVTLQDVVMTVGTTGALDTSMATLCNPGQCILLPKPCYTIYKCLADTRGIELKYYKLLVSN